MKAAVIQEPGVIQVMEVPTPTPGPGEVLLRVVACALCGTDQRVLKGEKPVDVPIVGHEITGVVERVGEGVTGIAKGERYAVQTVVGCGACPMCLRDQQNLCEQGFKAIGYQWNGGFAEHMVMPREAVAQGCLIALPEGIPDDIGTLIEPLSCCVNGMRCIPMEEMEHVVIFGGGIIGVLNGLVAKARGAQVVTVMDISGDRLRLHQELGLPFDHWVDTSQTDALAWVMDHTAGRGAAAAVVAASAPSLVPQALACLRRAGHLSIFAGMPKSDPIRELDLNRIHYHEIHIHGANSSVKRDYLAACELLGTGQIDGRRLITHRFGLDDFNKAVQTQGDPSAKSMKVIIETA